MAKRRRGIALLMAAGLTVGLVGCGTPQSDVGGSATAAGSDNEKGTIVFSTKTITNNEFQRVMVEECQKEVEAAGFKFELTLAGDELTVSKQVENIENAINRGAKGIVIAPMDGNAIIPALKKAKEANIPVIIADAAVAEGNEDLYVTYIGSDNYKIGYEAGKRMIEKVKEGKVCTVRGASGAMGGELRAQGFQEAIEEQDKVKLVNQQAGNWLSDVAMQVTENMLSSDPDMKGIFLCSDAMLSGVISGVQNKGLNPADIAIISVDGNKSALDSIKAGNCYGCVAQYPGVIGQKSGEIMADIVSGETKAEDYDKYIDSGYFFINPDNTEEAEDVVF
ncbi:sugar ABC transporter substrate-binding protein [Butyricicoccus faecihominis]|uniref:sugar ABC transporter substrate-binding protein n=1 Tax=Butyricicoccaceae TaxID=3085642 RepID=UPI002478CAF0|nr:MULTISPECIES: sugar ABC transporter substrate-binding protein [Butyricicoccaceae]MCQ5128491.1 sugar ABC transporter substrate-binding protein [Butyricicoccus faecihominis]WNX83318.1 sugar ABC transporter substrate-binding protein [Agathobaculum sp. NTUH-O15-33]